MRHSPLAFLFVCFLTLTVTLRAEATTLTFEDRPDSFGTQAFGPVYMGVTWNNWLEYAPYTVNGYLPDGFNAVFAGNAPVNSFTFADTIFNGASFSIFSGNPSIYFGTVYFEMYLDGVLKSTSSALSNGTNALTFLGSGYGGLVDEVRVLTTGTLMTAGGSAWIMDNVSLEQSDTAPAAVPEPSSWLLMASGLSVIAFSLRKRS